MRRWESGQEQGGSREERVVLAERVAQATDCPRFILGLAEKPRDLEARVAVLEAEIANLRA